MALTQLLGGPEFDYSGDFDSVRYADFHYFFNSGSVIRSNPWDSPVAPVAKVLNVKNITSDEVALNYVGTAGTIIATTLTSGSITQITSQTLPLGLDNTAWLSASFVSNFTGSVTARPTGSRFFELRAIVSIPQQTYVYTIDDNETTITRGITGFPTSGSAVYRCSRTIPYLDQPFWLIRDLAGCPGGTTTTAGPTTTTTTTAGPTTTTTTTLSTKKYLIESCEGPADISAVVNILNAPTLVVNQRVHVVGSLGGLYCYRVANTNPAPAAAFTITIDAIYPDCESCPES